MIAASDQESGRAQRVVGALLLCLALQLIPHAAKGLSLRVSRGVSCLDEAALRAELVHHLTAEELSSAGQVVVVGSEHDPRTVLIRVHHPDGAVFEREFSPAPERCPHLHQAVALVLAFALRAVTPPRDPASAPERTHVRPGALGFGLGPALGVGIGGGLSVGGAAGAELGFRRAALRASGLALRVERVQLRQGYYDSVLAAGRLDACGRWLIARAFETELCAGGLAGSLFARGGGVPESRSTWLRHLAVTLELGAGWHFAKGVRLRAGASMLFGLEPLSLATRDAQGALLDQRSLARISGLFALTFRYDLALFPRALAKGSATNEVNPR